jgi:predicted DCC family thiol-disulfide oxidoreductase YuxK
MGTPRWSVLYDGDCAFCRKSLELLQRWDRHGILEPVNARDATHPRLNDPRVAGAPLLERMHVLTPAGRLLGGYAAVREIIRHLPWGWLIAPWLYIPGVPWLGEHAYRGIARNRFRILPCRNGACAVQQTDRPITRA